MDISRKATAPTIGQERRETIMSRRTQKVRRQHYDQNIVELL